MLLQPNGVVPELRERSGRAHTRRSAPAAGTAPFARTVIVGSQVSVTAPAPQLRRLTSYAFERLVRRRGQSHNLVAPATPTTFTATFTPDCGSAVCGDGAVLQGCEQCDLGAANCAPGVLCAADCTSDCKVIGRCTTSGAPCATARRSPPTEGCCGNAVVDASAEACDDGNRLAGDCCSPSCQSEPASSCEPETCPALGPHLVAATVKRATTKDADHNGTSERWKTQGTFTLHAGQSIDPDSEPVRLELSENGQVLYAPTVPPATFGQKKTVCPIEWKFTNPDATLPTAIGWKTGKIKRAKLKGGAAGACGTSVQFNLGSGKNAPLAPSAGAHLRQTLRVGDDCFTALLSCTATGNGLKCETPED